MSTQRKDTKLSGKERATMTLLPCKYFKEPSITTRDCCLCCHESETKLNVPPLIEMGGTWLSPKNPVNKIFIFVRFVLTLYVIYVAIFSFMVFAKAGDYEYYFMFFTQWNAILACILMITKCVSSFKVYRYIRSKSENNSDFNKILYGELSENIDSNSYIWKWYIIQKVFLQISHPAMCMVVFSYWSLVYTPGLFPDENSKWSSFQMHGLSFVALCIDFAFSAERLWYKSFIFPVLLGIIYSIWNVIFEFTLDVNDVGDPYLYEVTNWSEHVVQPTITVISQLSLLAVFAFILTFIKNIILMKSGIVKMKHSYQVMTEQQIQSTEDEEQSYQEKIQQQIQLTEDEELTEDAELMQ